MIESSIQVLAVFVLNETITIPFVILDYHVSMMKEDNLRFVPDFYSSLGHILAAMLVYDCLFYHFHR